MGMGIGSVMSGVYSALSSSARATNASARNSGAASAVDSFNAVAGKTPAERMRALQFSQEGLKAEDRKPIDPKQHEAEKKLHQKMHDQAHQAADQSKVGLVVDIKA